MVIVIIFVIRAAYNGIRIFSMAHRRLLTNLFRRSTFLYMKITYITLKKVIDQLGFSLRMG